MLEARDSHSTFDTLLAFFVGVGGAAMCCWVAGPSLGLFIGGVMLAAIVVPPLALKKASWKSRFFAVVAAVDGIGLVWLTAMFQGQIQLFEWVWCFLVLAAFAFAIAGLAWCCASAGIHPIVSSAIAMVIALGWLAWPVWFSPHPVGSGLSDRAISVHPLFAINAAVPHLGIWTEQGLMYRLTNLGQDVPYVLPPPYYSIVTHAMIAGLLIAASYSLSHRERAGVRDDAPVGPQM